MQSLDEIHTEISHVCEAYTIWITVYGLRVPDSTSELLTQYNSYCRKRISVEREVILFQRFICSTSTGCNESGIKVLYQNNILSDLVFAAVNHPVFLAIYIFEDMTNSKGSLLLIIHTL